MQPKQVRQGWCLGPSRTGLENLGITPLQLTMHCVISKQYMVQRGQSQTSHPQKGHSPVYYKYHHQQLQPAFIFLCQYQHIQLFRFSFNQSNKIRWGARLVDVIKHLSHKLFLLQQHHQKVGQPVVKRNPHLMR